MDTIINLQKKIVPEMTDLLVERYRILRQVRNEQPIGRRALAGHLNLSERVLRSQVDFLKSSGLLNYSSAGMAITDEGMEILQELAEYVGKLQGLSSLEQFLLKKLTVRRVYIIPGDSDQEAVVKYEIGRAAAHVLISLLNEGKGSIVAVSGGTTLAAAASNIRGNFPDVVIVPARGGLGDTLELQANTVATVMARHLHASYRQLYVPDSVSQEILNSILAEDAGIRAVVDTVKQADILVHGIGRADVMARHRHLPQSFIDKLLSQGAVGEAVGQYSDLQGNQIYMTNNAGLMLRDLPKIGTVIGVFCGWHGKWIDTVLMRISDMFLAFPGLVFAMAVAGVLGGGLQNAIIALAAISWPKYARIARSQTLAQKETPYLKAARLSGSGTWKIIFKHILPNIMGPILVTSMLDIGTMMMELAGLSFLGLGAKPPIAEWGSMMSDTRNLLPTQPWVTLAPGFAIFFSVMIFNLLGDTVRDYLDPKRR